MALDPDTISKIAHLARLELMPEQVAEYTHGLARILSLIEEINAADTAGVEPMAHPNDGEILPLRADDITETNQREKYQAIAPATENGLYLVPRVIE